MTPVTNAKAGADVTRPRVMMVGKTLVGQAQYTTIQAAINAAAADATPPSATAPYTIEIFPGIYDEAPVCSTWVNLKGIGPKGSVVISQVDANIITLATQVQIENLTVRLVTPTAARNMFIDNGVACICRLTDVVIENVNPGNRGSTVFRFTGASTFALERCSFAITDNSSYGITTSAAGTNAVLEGNNFSLSGAGPYLIIWNSIGGTMTCHNNRLAGSGQIRNSNGSIKFSNDAILVTTPIYDNGPGVTVKPHLQQYEVYAGMKIQQAITAAAADTPTPSATAPYTILIHPGVYTEALTCSTYVNLKGIGPVGSVVIYQSNADVVTLATQVQIENVIVRLGTPSATRNIIKDNGVACVCRLVKVIIENVTPGGNSSYVLRCTGASTITLQGCSFNITDANAWAVTIQAAGTITMIDCNFTLNGDSTAVIRCGLTGAAIYCVRCNFLGQGAINCSAGMIRLQNCFYRTLSRSGSGNIVDESPFPASYGFRALKKIWDALIANENIATRVAVGGAVDSGGTGQIRLRINDNAVDAAGTESAADAAGSLASTFTPALTPRYCQQISVGAFRATTTMFFGLRGVPGAAVPGAAEHHAGFIWDGTNFKASSSNGGGVGGTTNLATPSTGAQHQLEVIIIGGTQVEFYVDGVLVVTHLTAAKIPTAALYFQEYEISSGAGGATTSDITLREGFIQETPA